MASGTDTNIVLFEESSYGQAPGTPAGSLLYHRGFTLASAQNLIDDDTLSSARTRQRPTGGNIDAGGAVDVNLSSENHGLLLKHALGAVTTSGADPYTHEFQPGALPTGLHIEKDHGDSITGNGRYERFSGVRVSRATFNFPQEGYANASFDLVGAGSSLASATLDAAPTDTSYIGLGMCSAAITEGGSAIAEVKNASVTLDNDLDTDGYAIGSGCQRTELEEGFASVSGSITAMFKSAALLEKAIAGTESSLIITLQKGSGDGSTGNGFMAFDVQHLLYERTSPPIEGPRGILITLPFKAFRSGSDLGFNVTTKNTISSY